MRSSLIIALVAAGLATAAFVAACSGGSSDPSKSGPAGSSAPVAAAQAPAPQGPTAGAPPGTGPVLETLEGGGYTYVRVNLGGADAWAAGPHVDVKVGEVVTLPAGMAMQDFRSETLNRTFPVVWFVGAIQKGAAPAAPAMPSLADVHKGVGAPAAAPAAAAPVERLEGGRSVEEIVTKRAELSGQDVAVRGRVVKFNAGIMGANWIHLQDGTGSAGTNDLTVTTDATVAVGDVVVVRGKVTTDKDFGSGYKYAVILEKAAVEKQ